MAKANNQALTNFAKHIAATTPKVNGRILRQKIIELRPIWAEQITGSVIQNALTRPLFQQEIADKLAAKENGNGHAKHGKTALAEVAAVNAGVDDSVSLFCLAQVTEIHKKYGPVQINRVLSYLNDQVPVN